MSESRTATTRSRAAVFLDRDGTLIEDVGYLGDPDGVRLLPGVGPALQRLQAAGFAAIVVTNQSAIGRGIITRAQYRSVTQRFVDLLTASGAQLDGIYHCEVVPGSTDRTRVEHTDRKPGPGMLLRAAREHRLDLAGSWMVGDLPSDVLAGRNAGCRGSILLAPDASTVAPELRDLALVAPDLPTAVEHILDGPND